VTYLIEYLGEFEFIFETILDHESRDHMGSFDAKQMPSKISCLGTFKSKSMCNNMYMYSSGFILKIPLIISNLTIDIILLSHNMGSRNFNLKAELSRLGNSFLYDLLKLYII
jgi:hypothetical protein